MSITYITNSGLHYLQACLLLQLLLLLDCTGGETKTQKVLRMSSGWQSSRFFSSWGRTSGQWNWKWCNGPHSMSQMSNWSQKMTNTHTQIQKILINRKSNTMYMLVALGGITSASLVITSATNILIFNPVLWLTQKLNRSRFIFSIRFWSDDITIATSEVRIVYQTRVCNFVNLFLLSSLNMSLCYCHIYSVIETRWKPTNLWLYTLLCSTFHLWSNHSRCILDLTSVSGVTACCRQYACICRGRSSKSWQNFSREKCAEIPKISRVKHLGSMNVCESTKKLLRCSSLVLLVWLIHFE